MLRAHRTVTRREREERPDGVLGLGGDLHLSILPYRARSRATPKVLLVSSLDGRHLYLCVPHRDDLASFLPAVLRGGVDVVQLREKDLDDASRIADATLMIPICREFGVPFIMNDSPELALAVGADGVHVGQKDENVSRCRELLGP